MDECENLEKIVGDLLDSLGKNLRVNYNQGVKGIKEIPKILLNRSRGLIKEGKYSDAEGILNDYKIFEKICIKNKFGFDKSLDEDYQNQISVKEKLEKRYFLDETSKGEVNRPYERFNRF